MSNVTAALVCPGTTQSMTSASTSSHRRDLGTPDRRAPCPGIGSTVRRGRTEAPGQSAPCSPRSARPRGEPRAGLLFHSELIAELADQGLGQRVLYVVSLNRIEQHFAFQFAPIDETNLAQLIDAVDKQTLARGDAPQLANRDCVSIKTTYGALETSCQRWHRDMSDIVDQR